MSSRIAKSNALKAIQNTIESGDTESVIVEIDEEVTLEETQLSVPVVTQNAPEGMSLDLCKQYKRKVEFCNRELITIHDKSVNKKDQGSANRGNIYVDLQAGMFEALKVNFMKLVKREFEIIPIASPKIELYGEAEERICLDLRMVIKEVEHKVKLIVHNTKCSINVQGCGDSYSQKFDHLDNLTAGEYFASHVIAKVVKIIDDSVDISKLNDYLRKLATEATSKEEFKLSLQSLCKRFQKL